MLYFIYQYLQGIAHEVFTDVNMFGHSLRFILDSSADLSESLQSFDFPVAIKSAFALIFSLAVIDKLRGRV